MTLISGLQSWLQASRPSWVRRIQVAVSIGGGLASVWLAVPPWSEPEQLNSLRLARFLVTSIGAIILLMPVSNRKIRGWWVIGLSCFALAATSLLLEHHLTAAWTCSPFAQSDRKVIVGATFGRLGKDRCELFSPGAIINFDVFCRRLSDPSDSAVAVSAFLRRQFSGQLQELLSQPRPTNDIEDAIHVGFVKDILLSEINRIIRGPSLFDTGRFAGINLSPATRTLAGQSPKEEALIRLNRLLLTDTFPNELRYTAVSPVNLLWEFPGRVAEIWNSKSIYRRGLVLAGIHVTSVSFFTLCAVALLQTAIPSTKVIKATVIELDLVGYSAIAEVLEEASEVEASHKLNAQIQGFVDQGLEAVRAKRSHTVIQTTGDGALVVLNRATDGHVFAECVHAVTRKHNQERGTPIAKRVFRIGIATGELVVESKSDGASEIAGMTIARAVRLETKAAPGEVLVDTATFEALTPTQKARYAAREAILGKRDERFDAYRCVCNPDGITDAEFFTGPPEAVATPKAEDARPQEAKALRKEIMGLFERLNVRKLDDLVFLLEMPIKKQPPNTISFDQRKTIILQWAEGERDGLQNLLAELQGLVVT